MPDLSLTLSPSDKDSLFLHKTLLAVACLKLRSRSMDDNLFLALPRASLLSLLPDGIPVPNAQIMLSYRTVGKVTLRNEPLSVFTLRVTSRIREPLFAGGLFLPRIGRLHIPAVASSGAVLPKLVKKLVFHAHADTATLANIEKHRAIAWSVEVTYSNNRRVCNPLDVNNASAALIQPQGSAENRNEGIRVAYPIKSTSGPVSQPKETSAQPRGIPAIRLEDIPPDLLTRKRSRGRPTNAEQLMRRMLLQARLHSGLQSEILDNTL